MIRKPSCLISCSHWLPDCSLSVLVGRHGAMNPAGRLRCNIMPIARDYSRASQSFLFARITVSEALFQAPWTLVFAGALWEGIMKTRYTVALLLLGLVLPAGEAVGQQAGPTLHRYM